jgi:exopolysaccharide biosynthesis polyprenyl glycosylphosphotransferase
MIKNRIKGLQTLHLILAFLFPPVWLHILVLVESFEVGFTLLRDQINLPLYTVAASLAGIVSQALQPSAMPHYHRGYAWIEGLRKTNRDVFVLSFVTLSLIWATKDKAMSRQFIGMYLVTSWGGLLLLNRFSFYLLSRALLHGEQKLRTLLVGNPSITASLRRWIRQREDLGLRFVGIVGSGSPPDDLALPVIGSTAELEKVLQRENIQQVILMETRNSKSWVRHVTAICQRRGVRLLIYNHWQTYFNQPMQALNEGDLTFFAFSEEPLQNPVNRIMKRLLDLFIAIPVVAFALPLLALVVKMAHLRQSPGPLFFVQMRSGFSGRPFRIYKFRTMHVANDNPAAQATRNDPRAFSFGSFLRRTSLDEFPQFLNVLKGQMSVVGPRPHMVEHDALFEEHTEIYRERHFVKPGITGLAQERGFRGEIHRPEDVENRIAHDIEYIRNWSIWLDLGLILKTVRIFLKPPPTAY